MIGASTVPVARSAAAATGSIGITEAGTALFATLVLAVAVAHAQPTVRGETAVKYMHCGETATAAVGPDGTLNRVFVHSGGNLNFSTCESTGGTGATTLVVGEVGELPEIFNSFFVFSPSELCGHAGGNQHVVGGNRYLAPGIFTISVSWELGIWSLQGGTLRLALSCVDTSAPTLQPTPGTHAPTLPGATFSPSTSPSAPGLSIHCSENVCISPLVSVYEPDLAPSRSVSSLCLFACRRPPPARHAHPICPPPHILFHPMSLSLLPNLWRDDQMASAN